jgi:hypothetical protein
MRTVVDANVLIAARLERDEYHEQARKLTTGIDRLELPRGIVLSSVLEEVINLINVHASHARASETLDGLIESSGFEMVHISATDLDLGQTLFRRYEGLSLTDAVVAAWMQRNGVQFLYSFDDDFDALEEITRLETAHDPSPS